MTSHDEFIEKMKSAASRLTASRGFQFVEEIQQPMYRAVVLRNEAMLVKFDFDGYVYTLAVGDVAAISDFQRITIVRAHLLQEDERVLSLEESVRFLIEQYPAIVDLFSKDKVRTTMRTLDVLMDRMARKRWPEQMKDVKPPEA